MQSGDAVDGRRPDGGTIDVVGLTGSRGTVTVTTSGAPRTWVLAIDFVQKVGVLWDPAGSVLSQTLTL